MKITTLSILLSILILLNTSIQAKENFTEKRVDYNYNGITYQGHLVIVSKKAPIVYLVHDWDGLTDYEVKRSQMLGELGYNVFAIDLFGKGVKADTIDDRKKHTGELYKDRKKMRGIMNTAIATMKKQGFNEMNGVFAGYCFGGAAVLELARSGSKIKGFATFHGGLSTPKGQNYKKAIGNIIVFHGTADTAITMKDFANLANELEKNKLPHEMITYGGAPHAFTVFDSSRYRKEADENSWSRFLTFLNTNLK